MGISRVNLHGQLSLRCLKYRKRTCLPNNGARLLLFVGWLLLNPSINASSGLACVTAVLNAYARMKPQPQRTAHSVALFMPTMQHTALPHTAGCATTWRGPPYHVAFAYAEGAQREPYIMLVCKLLVEFQANTLPSRQIGMYVCSSIAVRTELAHFL